MTRIKLCGIRRIEDIEPLNRLRPEYAGFIFVKNSKRYVMPEKAMELKALLDRSIKTVGVFRDADLGDIDSIVSSGAIDMIQLHGSEDNDYIRALKSRVSCEIIKAFGIGSEADVRAAEASAADYVLLDSPGGGTGAVFDHSLLASLRRPYFLAGGLTVENVGGFVDELNPFGVDVSSGIETEGIKDPAKIEAFVRAARKDR